MQRQTKISIQGGVLGPLELAQLREARKGIDKVLSDLADNLEEKQVAALTDLNQYIAGVIEEHISVGRRF